MARTVKGKATVKVAKPSASTTAKVVKARKRNAGVGKLHYADPKAMAFIATLEAVIAGKLIPADLRTATKGNAVARRQWCADNGAVIVNARDIALKTECDRPENVVRARVISLAKAGIIKAGAVGYVRALDTASATRNPSHPLAGAVYLYRAK